MKLSQQMMEDTVMNMVEVVRKRDLAGRISIKADHVRLTTLKHRGAIVCGIEIYISSPNSTFRQVSHIVCFTDSMSVDMSLTFC